MAMPNQLEPHHHPYLIRHDSATPQKSSRRVRRLGRQHFRPWTVLLLVLTGLLLITGCGDDDGGDVERVDVTNVRITDAASVFRILENRTFEFTTEGGGTGVFGEVENGRISFGTVDIGPDGIPRASFIMQDDDNVDPQGDISEGEGDSDGGASCNFNFRSSTIPTIPAGTLIKCPLCDTLVTAQGVPLGGTAFGQLIWVLNSVRDANNTPRFLSLAIDIIAGVDEAGNLITVDGIPVQAEPVP